MITPTDGIAHFTNRFNCYLAVFYFSCRSHLFDHCKFCVIKLNGSIKCHNCSYFAVQNLYVMVDLDSKLPWVKLLTNLNVLWRKSSHWSKWFKMMTSQTDCSKFDQRYVIKKRKSWNTYGRIWNMYKEAYFTQKCIQMSFPLQAWVLKTVHGVEIPQLSGKERIQGAAISK